MGTVVYNACYGGFGLSLDAQKLYLEKKGHTPKLHKGKASWDEHWYIKEPNDHYCRDTPRNDPALAEVVRELGDMASGDCARLIVLDLPKGTAFRIEEHDGYESIHTQDGTEWTIIVD